MSSPIVGITSYFDAQGVIKDFFKMRLSIIDILVRLGMKPSLPKLVQAGPPEVLSVLLDGRVIGSISSWEVEKVVFHLRRLKLSASNAVCSLKLSCLSLFTCFMKF